MSLRRMFEGVECPRFGDEAVTGNLPAAAPVTAPVTIISKPKRGRPVTLSVDDRKAKAAAKVAAWRKAKREGK